MPHDDNEATARVLLLVCEKLGLVDDEGAIVRGAPGELARRLGLPYGDSSAMVRKWLNGDHAPRSPYLLELLDIAGLLTPAASQAWQGEASARAAGESFAHAKELREATARISRGARPGARKRTG